MNAKRTKPPYDHVILALQGGGALGAYRAGVFEGMTETGYSPDWIAGVSLGAINGALIAGNPPNKRVERLRAFWNRVSSGVPLASPRLFRALHQGFVRASAALGSVVGVPGPFTPRVLPAAFMPESTPGALSLYDVDPLQTALGCFVDFDLIKRREVRLSVGAVNVRTGHSTYFDSVKTLIGAEHVLASAALPPPFPPIEIDGECYWDGGIVSNTPASYALDHSPAANVLIVQVDLFSAGSGTRDIMYSSRTRFDGVYVRENERKQGRPVASCRICRSVSRATPTSSCSRPPPDVYFDIVRLISRRKKLHGVGEGPRVLSRDRQCALAAGREDARRILDHPESLVDRRLRQSRRLRARALVARSGPQRICIAGERSCDRR